MIDNATITAAPELRDITRAYLIWSRNRVGNMETFLNFMASPSYERDEILRQFNSEIVFHESKIVIPVYK